MTERLNADTRRADRRLCRLPSRLDPAKPLPGTGSCFCQYSSIIPPLYKHLARIADSANRKSNVYNITIMAEEAEQVKVDETPISPIERRNSLEKHLQMRPDPKDLKDRHILLDTNAAP